MKFIVEVEYKDIGEDGIPFLCKEKFRVTASSLSSAKKKAESKMFKLYLNEYRIIDIKGE